MWHHPNISDETVSFNFSFCVFCSKFKLYVILIIFLIFTVVVVIAAGISIASRYTATTSGLLEDHVFEGFSKKFSNVDEIIVQDKDKTIKVKRSGKDWLMLGRSNYQASSEAVRNILVGVAELRLKEPKTERANLYSRLAVRDVSESGAKSTLLTICLLYTSDAADE